jgi:hypothetical protein
MIFCVYDPINKAKQLDKSKTDNESCFNKLLIFGYVHVRYNRLLSTKDKVSCDQCDQSWGTTSTTTDAKSNNGFFIRRVRIVFSGQVHPKVYVYIQLGFANELTTGSITLDKL